MSAVDRASDVVPTSSYSEFSALRVGAADVLVALLTFALSLAALAYGIRPTAQVPIFLLAHLGVVSLPAMLWLVRARRSGELTLPVLLTVGTFVSGPVGALGCAFMAIALSYQRPSPTRLQEWYNYIAGVVVRTELTRIYDELVSGRLPTDPAAKVPRFRAILNGPSVDEQQLILAVMGRRYHPAFRPALRNALRNKNGFIRAQAAAVAARLDIEEKNQLWSSVQTNSETSEADFPGRVELQPGP